MSPDISIIVPVYNCDKYLKRCLDGLLNQSFKNIEIICINDGSKDNSLNILNDFSSKDKRVIIIDQENTGPAEARNNGLKKARGEYIMFCDSDDSYEPEMCEKMLNTIRFKNVDLVVCDCTIVKDDESYNVRDADIFYHRLIFFGFHSISYEFKRQVNSVLWNKIFKREIIEKFNVDFPSGYYHDDMAFVFQYLCVIKNVYGIDDQLYNYNLRCDSIMHKTYFSDKERSKLFDVIDASLYFYNKLVQNNILDNNKQYFVFMLCGLLYWTFSKCRSEEQMKDFVDHCNEILLFDLDLDTFPKSKELRLLKLLKDRRYDIIIPMMIEQKSKDFKLDNVDKKKSFSIKKITKLLVIVLRSYLLFPYYIYKIYKNTKKISY